MDALARSGDLDEKLFLYHEDCELQIRLRQLGYDCVLVPRSRVLHKYTERFSARKYALLERNRWLVLLKDGPGTIGCRGTRVGRGRAWAGPGVRSPPGLAAREALKLWQILPSLARLSCVTAAQCR